MKPPYRAIRLSGSVNWASFYSFFIILMVVAAWNIDGRTHWWLLLIIPILYIPHILERRSKTQKIDRYYTTNSVVQYWTYIGITWSLFIFPILASGGSLLSFPYNFNDSAEEERDTNWRSHLALAIFFYFIAAIALLANIWFALGFFLIASLFHRRSKKYSSSIGK